MPRWLSKDTVQSIVALLDQGKSLRQIAQELGISLGTAHYYCTIHQPSLPKSKGGRPRKIKSADAQYLKHLIQTQKVTTARELTQLINKMLASSVSTQTVHHELKGHGIKAVVRHERHQQERQRDTRQTKLFRACIPLSLSIQVW
ncbi:hypothetical protein NUW54_g6887 [Trametes sanguinea]|uniref:Uncharacterized protein n=1 Tax=Trametes sanguinea TaxID=158606 RepID=A0ACC1PTJ7_9APHY|nr:hypothetical protein NUW54_g6887 [Trametes sanguinea]